MHLIWRIRFVLRMLQRIGFTRYWQWDAAFAEMKSVIESDETYWHDNPVWSADECLSYWNEG